ncbi:MAG: hypothetical protein ACO2OT_00330 [Candidatus Caldipriscus sp.]
MIFDFGSESGGILVFGENENLDEISLNISTFSALTVERLEIPEDYNSFVDLVEGKNPKFILGDNKSYPLLLRYAQERGITLVFKPARVEYDISSGGVLAKFRVKENLLAVFSINAPTIAIAI